MHIARRAITATDWDDGEQGSGRFSISVYVKEDVEPFTGLAAFHHDVTADALSNFSVITIDVSGQRGRIIVDLARKPLPDHGPPSRGVLVTAESALGDAAELRETVARAIERRARRRDRQVGEVATPGMVRPAVAATVGTTAFPVWISRLQALIPGVLAGAAAAQSSDQADLRPRDVVAVAVVASLAGLLWIAIQVLVPRVEVQAVTRAKRVADLAYKGVGAAVVTALVGATVKVVLGAS